MTIAYIRISSDKQDCEVQKIQIFQYCKQHKITIDESIEVKMSSKRSLKNRRIEELEDKLKKGDVLISVELSRLGRSMLEVMNLVVRLSEKGVQFVFLRQPELSSFKNPASKLLLSLYAYMAETERDFISQRTKAGLVKAKQNGKKLGRPKGSFSSEYDKDIDKIKAMLNKGESKRQIWQKLGYTHKTFKSFINFIKSRKIMC